MRGDSVRDLYAKTLAVAGLGLLAAAGAIVDYWPVGGQLPAVTSAASLRPRLPVLAKNVAIEIPAPSTAQAAAARSTSPRRFNASLKTVMFVPTPLAAPVIDAPPAPEFAIAAPDPDAAAALVAGDILIGVDLVAPPSDDAAAGGGDDRPFLAGALQRTKDTLKDARSFLGNKLGNIAGAFRKVSPFRDGMTLTQFR